MNQGTFSATMIRLGPSKRIFVFRPKIGSFSSPWFLAKNYQILKSAFFTCLSPYRSWPLVKGPWERLNCFRGHFRPH